MRVTSDKSDTVGSTNVIHPRGALHVRPEPSSRLDPPLHSLARRIPHDPQRQGDLS